MNKRNPICRARRRLAGACLIALLLWGALPTAPPWAQAGALGQPLPDPFELPRKGEVRIAYAGGQYLSFNSIFDGRLLLIGGADQRLLTLEATKGHNGPWTPPPPLTDDELDRQMIAGPKFATVLAFWRAEGEFNTLDATAHLVGRIIRSARRQRDPGDPFLLYLWSPMLGTYSGLVDGDRPAVRWDDPYTLATERRYRFLFAIDPREGADAQHAFTVDPKGELREGQQVVTDRRLDEILRFGPPDNRVTLSLTPLEEDKTRLWTVSLALVRIINAGERSLGKLPPAQWPAAMHVRGAERLEKIVPDLARREEALYLAQIYEELVGGYGWQAADTLRRMRPSQPPAVQEQIDVVVEQIAARFAKSCSVVVYIKSPAMTEEVRKATTPTTRPAK